MTTFTIETETNNITAHATQQEAKAVPNAERFSSAEELAQLAADWPTARLMEIWNGIPGVTPVRKFTDRKAATTRIWNAIQTLGESMPAEVAPQSEIVANEATDPAAAVEPAHEAAQAEPEATADQEQPASGSDDVQPEPVTNDGDANVCAQSPDVAPTEAPATKKATRKTPTGEAAAKAPREGSKTEQVIAMLKAEGGTTLEAIMAKMNWLKHTTRAMLSAGGSLTRKHGLVVTSEKVGDKRVYSIKS
jgi:hypothetical protein